MMKFGMSLLLVLASVGTASAADDWKTWRGPNGNGVADKGQKLPTSWTATKNVIWKSPIPGRGHSSPIIAGNRIFLTTADTSSRTQSVLCYDRESGKPVWKKDVNQGGFEKRIHNKNTHASPTVACDGERVFAVFINHGNAQLTALSMDGKILWQKAAGGYQPKAYQFGYGPSPTIYKNTVIVSSEYEAGGFLAAFDTKTGNQVWKTRRDPVISFSSPIVANIAGRDQLLISGGKKVSSFDPASGKVIWSIPGIWTVTCGTMVWDDDVVFASGGYPTNGTIAVKADGSKKVVWKNNVKCYEQSMLVVDGYLYGVNDNGIAYCWRCKDGKEMWKKRLGGPVSSSPILAGGNIYFTNEKGTTFVYKPNPQKLVPVAKNQLGDEGFATPTICGNRLYYRSASSSGGPRQEMLFCIGSK